MNAAVEADSTSLDKFDFTKSANQMLIIESVRLSFLWTILLIIVTFRIIQPQFVNTEVMIPIYVMLTFAFLLNLVYLFNFSQALKNWFATALLFLFDTAFITVLNYYNEANQSIFLFLYLVNIILCGFVFRSKGALYLALATSVAFNLLIILGPDIKGQTLFFSVGLNNLAFYAVAILSGYLSDQLNFMGTELVARGKDLRALKNLNDLIVQNVATGILGVDKKFEVILSNRATNKILERDPKDIVGVNINQIFTNFSDTIGQHSEEFIKQNSARFELQYTNASRDPLTLEFIASALLDEESRVRAYILAFQDITVVRRLEFAVQQSEKLAAVGQLAAGIAHEIRNPLASISGSIELLGQSAGGMSPAETKKLMSIVLKEIDRLNNLITEFLDYVKPNQVYDEKVSLSQLLKDIVEMSKMNKSLGPDVEIKLDLKAVEMIRGSRDKLKQAWLNILINAYHAVQTKENGEIRVSTYDTPDSVVVKIADNGIGIEEARLKKIFDPFHTTKAKGTGLGLAVTHKIIEAHQAKIFVESKKDIGTEFRIEFPLGKKTSTYNELALAQTKKPEDNLNWETLGNGPSRRKIK